VKAHVTVGGSQTGEDQAQAKPELADLGTPPPGNEALEGQGNR